MKCFGTTFLFRLINFQVSFATELGALNLRSFHPEVRLSPEKRLKNLIFVYLCATQLTFI